MAAKEKRTEKFTAGYRKTISRNAQTKDETKKDLFDREWEVFVIKRDAEMGKLIGRTARCALCPV